MTRVAIHQPQYLPWLAYFAKAEMCDVFVYLDHVQYQKGGVQNRNQIKTANGPSWLTVPVKAAFGDAINVTHCANDTWSASHIRTIQQSYARADHSMLFEETLAELLARPWDNLAELNIAVTDWMFDALGSKCKRMRSSQMTVSGQKDDLVIEVCKAAGATEYISGKGAMAYQDPEKFEAESIKLTYASYQHPTYRQCYPKLGFLPDLSALDLILNEGPDAREILLSGIPAR